MSLQVRQPDLKTSQESQPSSPPPGGHYGVDILRYPDHVYRGGTLLWLGSQLPSNTWDKSPSDVESSAEGSPPSPFLA